MLRTFLILTVAGAEVCQMSWKSGEGKGIDDYLVNQCRRNGQHPPTSVLGALVAQAKPFIETLTPTALDLGLVVTELQKVLIPRPLQVLLCKQLAGRLGVRPSVLEEAAAAREKEADSKKLMVEPDPEPWPDPVDGALLLKEIATLI